MKNKEFIKEYKKYLRDIEYDLEKEIKDIYELYELYWECSIHREIFEHLIETDFIDWDDAKRYEIAIEKLENFVANKPKIGYVKE